MKIGEDRPLSPREKKNLLGMLAPAGLRKRFLHGLDANLEDR